MFFYIVCYSIFEAVEQVAEEPKRPLETLLAPHRFRLDELQTLLFLFAGFHRLFLKLFSQLLQSLQLLFQPTYRIENLAEVPDVKGASAVVRVAKIELETHLHLFEHIDCDGQTL